MRRGLAAPRADGRERTGVEAFRGYNLFPQGVLQGRGEAALCVSERGPGRMCGIVGYVGGRPCRELLLEGLEKLEYRGYDSAGVSVLENGRIDSVRAVGNLSFLRQAMAESTPETGGVATATQELNTGIGHTRWATHGRVTEENAHPHFDTAGRVHIVLNGIVENHKELRDRLAAEGAEFTSETDAEVVAHLISSHYAGDLLEAFRAAYSELRGHYAFVAMAADE